MPSNTFEIIANDSKRALRFGRTLQTYIERPDNIGIILHAKNVLDLLDTVLTGINKPKMKDGGYYTHILENNPTMQNFEHIEKLHNELIDKTIEGGNLDFLKILLTRLYEAHNGKIQILYLH